MVFQATKSKKQEDLTIFKSDKMEFYTFIYQKMGTQVFKINATIAKATYLCNTLILGDFITLLLQINIPLR